MSVIGFDFGTQSCVIAAAQKGGIDVLLNESSSRQTPCMAGFGEKQRAIGEAAATQYQRNIRNTVTNVKRILGRKFQETDVQDELKHIHYKTFEQRNHEVGIELTYAQQKRSFSPVSITAMILQKLKESAEKATEKVCKDVVISVPGWWTQSQRKALLDASYIAGLNCLRLLNDHAASALQYGIYKTNLSETDPLRVMFVDMGYSNTSVCVVEFLKGKLKILSTAYDRNLGGRNFDWVLMDHFLKEFKAKYKLDLISNDRAMSRLESACERLKKILNTVSEAPINIDSIMNDIDVKGMMKRSDFDEMCKPLLERLLEPVKQAITDSGVSADQLQFIEITGGGTRLISVQAKLSEFFKRDLSKTLNHEESVARGCALQCAMLSPLFRVRDFSITDISKYPVRIIASKATNAMDIEEDIVDIFTENNPFPCPKMVTFHRKQAFEISAEYSRPDLLPSGASVFLGKWSIAVPPITAASSPEANETSKVRVKVKLDIHGDVVVESAQLIEPIDTSGDSTVVLENQEKKEKEDISIGTKANDTSKMNSSQQQQQQQYSSASPNNSNGSSSPNGKPQIDEPPSPRDEKSTEGEKPAKKKKIKRTDISIAEILRTGLSEKELVDLADDESKMVASDHLALETAEKKNALEAYVYDMKNKICEELATFCTEKHRETFGQLLDNVESWLYGEGEDVAKSIYIKKLDELKAQGEPIAKRKYEYENRYDILMVLRGAIEQFRLAASSEDPKYEHIEKEEKNKILQECDTLEKWLNDTMAKQDHLPKHEDPLITCAEMNRKKVELEKFSWAILNKPKPKPPEPPKTEEKATKPPEQQQQQQQQQNTDPSSATKPSEDSPMEDAQGHSEQGEQMTLD